MVIVVPSQAFQLQLKIWHIFLPAEVFPFYTIFFNTVCMCACVCYPALFSIYRNLLTSLHDR